MQFETPVEIRSNPVKLPDVFMIGVYKYPHNIEGNNGGAIEKQYELFLGYGKEFNGWVYNGIRADQDPIPVLIRIRCNGIQPIEAFGEITEQGKIRIEAYK